MSTGPPLPSEPLGKLHLYGTFILPALVASHADDDIVKQPQSFKLAVMALLSICNLLQTAAEIFLHEFRLIWEYLCFHMHVSYKCQSQGLNQLLCQPQVATHGTAVFLLVLCWLHCLHQEFAL